MSGLNAFNMPRYAGMFTTHEVYLKSEAAKEIAWHKYKRCLDMAKWCFANSNYHFGLALHGKDIIENHRKSILYSKWHHRWLELAEKFYRMSIPSVSKEVENG